MSTCYGQPQEQIAKTLPVRLGQVNDWLSRTLKEQKDRENSTQRGNTGTALAESVAAALRLIAKAALTGNIDRILSISERGEQTVLGKMTKGDGEGIGQDLLLRYFHQQGISGMGEYTVKQQLVNLKAFGAYARIITEVAAALRLLAKAVLTGNLSRILERLSERAEQTVMGDAWPAHSSLFRSPPVQAIVCHMVPVNSS